MVRTSIDSFHVYLPTFIEFLILLSWEVWNLPFQVVSPMSWEIFFEKFSLQISPSSDTPWPYPLKWKEIAWASSSRLKLLLLRMYYKPSQSPWYTRRDSHFPSHGNKVEVAQYVVGSLAALQVALYMMMHSYEVDACSPSWIDMRWYSLLEHVDYADLQV